MREQLSCSAPRSSPFSLQIGNNRIDEESCAGRLQLDGHAITWDLRYRSTFGASLSDKGWIGFSRTPHSNAMFSGEIILDGRSFRGDPLGFGLQGHNCGYRHRNIWTWTHCVFPTADGKTVASFEALEYELPLGLCFRRALLWSSGKLYEFRKLTAIRRDRENLCCDLECANPEQGLQLTATIDGSGASLHRLPYLKTDCSGTFEVSNNSLARAAVELTRAGQPTEIFVTENGAVLEMAGD